ncbi:MAG: HD domain-containing protein [Candidatus Bathyarchaeia archaeon]
MVKYFRDPIYDYIKFEREELGLIDCFLFQRLRGIHHQGTAFLTYPSINHTRFEHSLGVACISTEIFDMLSPFLRERGFSEEDLRVFREAERIVALWHDIGIGPFSHVSDRIMHRYIREKISPHEWISANLVEKYLKDFLSECGFKQSETIAKKVCEIINHKCKIAALHQIFDGAIDADFMDYVSRSSYMLGTRGWLDVRRLIHNVIITKKGDLGFARQALSALEFAIIERYREFKYINFHHTVCFSDELMARIMWHGIDEKIFDEKDFTLPHFEELVKVDIENLRKVKVDIKNLGEPSERIAKPTKIVDDHYIIQLARKNGKDLVSHYISILDRRSFYSPLWKISTYLDPEQGGIIRTICFRINQKMEKDPVKTMNDIERFEEELQKTLGINEKPVISFKPYRPFKEEVAHLFLLSNNEDIEMVYFSPVAWMFFFHKKLVEYPDLFKPPPVLYFPLYVYIPRRYIKNEDHRRELRKNAINKLKELENEL